MKQILTGVAVAAAALLAAPAHAVLIAPGVTLTTDFVNPNLNGQNDNSGKTSARLTSGMYNSSGQLRIESNYFIETFDLATAMVSGTANGGQGTILPGSLTTNTGGIDIRTSGCAFNSYGALGNALGGPGSPGGVAVSGGGFSVLKGDLPPLAAAPLGDSSCYGVSPQPGQGNSGSVTVSYADLLGPLDTINYFGIYYGSIDDYNDLYFYGTDNGTGTPVAVVRGEDVRDVVLAGCPSGGQTAACSNVYVNLDFADDAVFRSFRFETTGIAVEVDNIVVGRTSRSEVPEPASLALLGAGLAALGLSRRRKAAK